MKYNKKTKSFIILLIGVFLIILILIYSNRNQNLYGSIEDKYSNNEDYSLIDTKEKGDYLCYLGVDKEKIYMDLSYKNKIFGGSEINKNSKSLGIFNFIDNQTIIVVFGINNFSLKGYEMTVSAIPDDKDIVEKSVNTENKTNIIDIYILDKKYNSFPDINFIYK